MNKVLKVHILITSLALFFTAFLSFWALEKDKCFEIQIKQELKIKVNCLIAYQYKFLFPSAPGGVWGVRNPPIWAVKYKKQFK